MPLLQTLRAAGRAVRKAVFKLARVLFVVLLIIIPAPFAQLVVALVRPHRKNLPAEVVKKREE